MFDWPLNMEAVWPWVAVGGLVLARPLGLVSVAPGWGTAAIGPRLRLMIAVALGVLLVPAMPAWGTLATSPGAWVGLALVEVCIGVALGLTGSLVVAGARQAGELVGMQAGLAPASVLDPESPGSAFAEADDPLTPFGHLYGLIALALFLALDGPLRLVDALAASYRAAPPGLGLFGGESPSGLVPDLFGRVSATLGLALRAAAPAGLGILLAGIVLAVMARSSGARPLSGLAWPARAAVGVVLVMLSMTMVVGVMTGAWGRWVAEFAR